MQEAIARMLAKYESRTLDDGIRALREIIQEVALLGLWRAKFFEKAAFYGGSCLRILHGLDRFSEDLDFSLLEPMETFELARYTASLQEEISAFGFHVEVHMLNKAAQTPIQSAFLKANTRRELLIIEYPCNMANRIPAGQLLKIKLEVDTNPPAGFDTQTRYLLQPVPFAVRAYALPDLFAGKMHALLCRRWKNRIKGRDWFDFVWFAANHPQIHLSHLEQRMRQTGHWTAPTPLFSDSFHDLLNETIDRLDVEKARREVTPFVKQQERLMVWSKEFFRQIVDQIQII